MKKNILLSVVRYLLVTLSTIWLFVSISGCSAKQEAKTESASSNSVKVEKSSSSERQIFRQYFLGHYMTCDQDSVYSELERVYADDPEVNFDMETGNIEICGILFHVNLSKQGNALSLMTSVSPDSRGMKRVRKYISKYHGKEEYEEPGHYSWLPYTDSTLIGKDYPVIHLRGVHAEDGGTVIFIF